MHDACPLRQGVSGVSWAVVTIAVALCSSCSRRPGETSSEQSAGREQTTPSVGSAARVSNEPPANTFEHPALQEWLVHERWQGDLDRIVNGRILRGDHDGHVEPTSVCRGFHGSAKAVIAGDPGEQLSRFEDLSGREVYYFINTIPYENLRRLSEDLLRDDQPADGLRPEDHCESI